ncbi:hypothetical protein ACOMHN_027473 [Nucella lapillus]
MRGRTRPLCVCQTGQSLLLGLPAIILNWEGVLPPKPGEGRMLPTCPCTDLGTAAARAMAEPDLSRLPCVALVPLFKALSLPDRGRLASCCRRLPAMMAHGSVWTDVTLELGVSVHSEGPAGTHTGDVVGSLRARDRVLIQKYGQYFKKVHVVVSSTHIDRDSVDVLTGLCERGVVKSLHLRLDRFLSQLMKWQADPYVERRSFKNRLPTDC